MTNMELVLNMLAEVSSTEISKSSDVKSKENAKQSVIEGSTIAKNTREQIEAKPGKKIVTNINNKNSYIPSIRIFRTKNDLVKLDRF